MARLEWETIEPWGSQGPLSVPAMRKSLQTKWPQGPLCPTATVSEG